MTLTLYSTTDDNRVVNKTLSAVGEGVTVRPTERLDMMSPNFLIDYNAAALGANYCYCDTFSRYYYINDITLETGHRMTLHCTLDPLYTYSAYLALVPATVIRAESTGSTDVPDKKLPIDPNAVEIVSAMGSKAFMERSYSLDAASVVLVTGRGES